MLPLRSSPGREAETGVGQLPRVDRLQAGSAEAKCARCCTITHTWWHLAQRSASAVDPHASSIGSVSHAQFIGSGHPSATRCSSSHRYSMCPRRTRPSCVPSFQCAEQNYGNQAIVLSRIICQCHNTTTAVSSLEAQDAAFTGCFATAAWRPEGSRRGAHSAREALSPAGWW